MMTLSKENISLEEREREREGSHVSPLRASVCMYVCMCVCICLPCMNACMFPNPQSHTVYRRYNNLPCFAVFPSLAIVRLRLRHEYPSMPYQEWLCMQSASTSSYYYPATGTSDIVMGKTSPLFATPSFITAERAQRNIMWHDCYFHPKHPMYGLLS